MVLIDFFRRKKTSLENEKGNIHSESIKSSDHKIQEVAKGESRIVKCVKCRTTFKLVDTIPVKGAPSVHCPVPEVLGIAGLQ